ncbi:MAG: polysaccharide deacetylase family protein [Acetobacteraceae bacterium]
MMPWKKGYTLSDEKGLGDDEIRWPGAAQCCLGITVDLSVAVGAEGIRAANLVTEEALFGATQGLSALRSALARYHLRATFAVPAVIAYQNGDVLRALVAEGHEIAAHGFKHEDTSGLTPEAEAERINRTTEILVDVTRRRPLGWFSLPRQGDHFAVGTISERALGLLLEAGYNYLGNGLADDIPHYCVTDFVKQRALLALPYYYHFDDQFFLMFPRRGTGLERPDVLLRNWRCEFRAQYERGRYFHMTLHPQHIGWCNRLRLLTEFLAELGNFADLWNPTGMQCARYWLDAYPPRKYLHLEPSIWQDYPGSLS